MMAYDDLGRVAEAFYYNRGREGYSFNEAYREVVQTLFHHLGVCEEEKDEDCDELFVKLLRRNDLRSLLEVGCGTCEFLASIAVLAEKAGCTLCGIDRHPSPSIRTKGLIGEGKIEVIQGDASAVALGNGFDMIIGSGVLSFTGSLPEDGTSLCFETLVCAIQNAKSLARNSVENLSDHPKAAVIVNSYGSILMLYRDDIQKFCQVMRWDQSRRCGTHTFLVIYSTIWDDRGKTVWDRIYHQSANCAVLTKRQAVPPPGTS